MTHRKFNLKDEFVAYEKGKTRWYFANRSPSSPKHIRLRILTQGLKGVSINWHGGIAYDRNVKYLLDRKLATIAVHRHLNGFNQYRTYITWRVLFTTQKGKEYLERYAK